MQQTVPRLDRRTLTETDYVQLLRLFDQGVPSPPGGDEVQHALATSQRIPAYPVAPGLITMNAQVFLVTGADEQLVRVTLCYPHEADPARGRISVLSPLGSSLLGRSSGQTVHWRSFGRVHGARILAVLTPLRSREEASA